MKNRIYITTQDKQRLEDLLAEAAIFDARHRGDLKSLGEELQRAVIVESEGDSRRCDHNEFARSDD